MEPVGGQSRWIALFFNGESGFFLGLLLLVLGVIVTSLARQGSSEGLGLLFQASMLFIGLIVLLMVQPFVTGAPFALIDVLVTFVLGLVCFVPFALFARGVVSVGRASDM